MNEGSKELLDALKDLLCANAIPSTGCKERAAYDKACAAIAKAEATLAVPQPSDDGWIPWAGGECPVTVGTRVDAKFRDGEKAYNVPAGDCAEDPDSRSASDWSRTESDYDIIAYRVVKP